MKDDSACRNALLCAFEVTEDHKDAQVEVCRFCGKKIVYNKVGGRGG